MTIGQIVRRILGKNFQPVGKLYRSIFVDIHKIAAFIGDQIPAGSRCLDIGGGDGMIVSAMLEQRPDLHVTMTDIAPNIGSFIDPKFLDRVMLHPATTAKSIAGTGRSFNAITIADVLHHVPADARSMFWADLREICRDTGCRTIIVKDVCPGTLRGFLSLMCDRYITGDRHVTLIRPDDMIADIKHIFQTDAVDISHSEPDKANYCLVVNLK